MITHDRWPRIKEIFQSAQQKSPAERLDFLNEICGDDQSIREEVEALLIADDSNDDFLSIPAYEFAACVLADDKTELEFEAGQKVGRYTILWPLGSGGMGQIYLAQDEQLGRKIALKLIAREFATDPRRVLRFEQEARAASALNHPNVCVIHEIGVTENNRHFIAMEHIQGTTLRDKLTREPLSLLEALHIARQVADALAAAHAAGIVHRDIKPENIMLRPDGYVKILDFGLAKLTEVLPKPDGTPAFPTNVRTEAGTLMGTVKYMSPEQLRESELDERTDIWSLGVVLYEMLTRTTPFEARTPADTIARIVGPQPPSLALASHVPARFRKILGKALEKDRADRYQTVTKLGSDLYALQRELERQSDNRLMPQPGQAPISWYATLSAQKTQTLAPGSTLTRLKSQAIHTADFLFTEIRSHKAATLASMTAVLLLLLYLPAFIGWVTKSSGTIQVKELTHSGTSVWAAVTRDGKLVAHAEDENGKQKLVLSSAITYAAKTIVWPEEVRYLGITFAPDNLTLYVTREEKDGSHVLYRTLSRDGTLVKVKDDVDGPVSFSPQGDKFAFVRFEDAKGDYQLIVSDVFDPGNDDIIATRKNGDTFSYGVSWSPDGNTIVCPAGRWDKGFFIDLMAFDLAGGSQRVIGSHSWFSVYQVAWENDASLVISARAPEAMQHQLWRVSYPAGEVRRITVDDDEYMGVSIAGDQIITVVQDRSWQLWVAELDDFDNARFITSGNSSGYGVSWTPKGDLVYSAVSHDRLNIWRIALDGSYTIPLTNAGNNYHPVVFADGRSILFSSNRSGSYEIYSMNTEDGGDLRQLTQTDGNFNPAVSPDNQWLAYDTLTKSKSSVWKMPLQGGTPVKVADRYRMPVFSPDNLWLAVRYEELEERAHDLVIFPVQGVEPVRKLEIPRMEWQRVQWIDKHTLSYLKRVNGTSNIWSYDLDTNTEKQLTHFNGDQIYAYGFSPDFKQVACQRGRKLSDVTIISSER